MKILHLVLIVAIVGASATTLPLDADPAKGGTFKLSPVDFVESLGSNGEADFWLPGYGWETFVGSPAGNALSRAVERLDETNGNGWSELMPEEDAFRGSLKDFPGSVLYIAVGATQAVGYGSIEEFRIDIEDDGNGLDSSLDLNLEVELYLDSPGAEIGGPISEHDYGLDCQDPENELVITQRAASASEDNSKVDAQVQYIADLELQNKSSKWKIFWTTFGIAGDMWGLYQGSCLAVNATLLFLQTNPGITPSCASHLSEYKVWMNATGHQGKYPQYESYNLLSGIITPDCGGIAIRPGLATGNPLAITYFYRSSGSLRSEWHISITASHEVGHTWSLPHDDTAVACNQNMEVNIMQTGWVPRRGFCLYETQHELVYQTLKTHERH